MEVFGPGPEGKLQAAHEKLLSFILPIVEGNQNSVLANLSTCTNEGDDGILKQKESVLPNFIVDHPNSHMFPQPPTLMAEVVEIKIVTPPRTPKEETILQEFLSPNYYNHEQEIQVGYQFSKLQNLGPCTSLSDIAKLIEMKLDRGPCELELLQFFGKTHLQEKQIVGKDCYDNRSSNTGFQAIMLWMVAVKHENKKKCLQVVVDDNEESESKLQATLLDTKVNEEWLVGMKNFQSPVSWQKLLQLNCKVQVDSLTWEGNDMLEIQGLPASGLGAGIYHLQE
ncbi:hypothetical protein O6P43_024080 [Quillaja saponaria]|uniref:Uncharacterized protein n=1 Tax=Quillaja saponaria TaxID=32244 RepID=A0AAD7L786_QUISA|nr:hypothetical protein O6P43_024080 [Quillaja saponaria]